MLAEYGAERTRLFPSGPDGGRDVLVDVPPGDDSLRPGLRTIQVKFMESPRDARANSTWLRGRIREEMRRWASPARKERRPSVLVFVTNASLSGTPGGGREQAEQQIRDAAADVDGWDLGSALVWDRSTVNGLLAAHGDVRRKFGGLLTPGDVLAALGRGETTMIGERRVDVEAALRTHARLDLRAGTNLNLDEVGETGRLQLSDVGIDLPLRVRDDQPLGPLALRTLLRHGDRVLRPSVRGHAAPPFHVLVGGPGQGKTTITRLLVRAYEASMLDDDENLTSPVRVAADSTLERLRGLGIPRPISRRWAFRVNLAEYADSGAPELVSWIANKVSEASPRVLPADMRAWLRDWPWLLVLDGLDEVAAPDARALVVRSIEALVESADDSDADLMIVATTRPQGYADEFGGDFQRIELAELSPQQAVEYTRTVTRARLGPDSPLALEIVDRAEAALADVSTSRLMRTPLQVMIMSLLLEQYKRPPRNRYALFSAYYDVIYGREKQKPGFLAELLADHRKDVDEIHRRVGFELQSLAEGDSDAEATLAKGEFDRIVAEQLASQGYEGDGLKEVAARMRRAATERLVLLVAKGRDGVGFELRPLQEFFAARWLVSGLDQCVLDRLAVASPSAHWRNTWLFAVGHIFEDRGYLFESVVHQLRDFDVSDDLSELTVPGARLAVEILDDDLATASPKYRKLLVKHALDVLQGVSIGAGRLGEVLAAVGEDDLVRGTITTALDRALKGTSAQQYAARTALRELADRSRIGALGTRARQMKATRYPPPPPVPGEARPEPGAALTLAEALPDETRHWPSYSPAARFARECRGVKTTAGPDGEFLVPERLTPGPAAYDVVSSPSDVQEVCTAIAAIPSWNWGAQAAAAALLMRARERITVSDRLRDICGQSTPPRSDTTH